MLKNRPIVAITIGYIIGIILGLYCKISIVFLYLLFFIIYLILKLNKKINSKEFKLISFRRYFRYVKIIFTKNVIILIIFSSICSNTIVLYQNIKYKYISDNFDNNEIHLKVEICSDKKENKYNKIYVAKVIDNNLALKNKKIYLNINKNIKCDLNYGNKISVTGIISKAKSRTNFRAFDYNNYLKTLGICGTIEVEKIENLRKNSKINIFSSTSFIRIRMKEIIKNNFGKDVASIVTGIILGDTEEIEQDLKDNFSNSNLSHILAVSGMHIGYIVLFCKLFFGFFGKRKTNILTIIVLIFYLFIIGFHPSAIRATIMVCVLIFSKIIYKKSDIWTNLSLSLLLLLIYNPYLITNTGLLLSFGGTIGIVIYAKSVRVTNKIYNAIYITLAVLIMILPILANSFNKIPIINIFISSFIGILIAPIVAVSIIFVILILVFQNKKILLIELLRKIIDCLINIIIKITEFSSKIPLGKIYVITPSIISIIIYYFIVFIIFFLYKNYTSKNSSAFKQRIRNLVSLFKFRLRQSKRKIISGFLIFIIIFSILKISPKNLKIYFIDVGQGDSCLIVTPHNKKILIDGGGSENSDFDVGKNILLPYLLDRGIKKLDYIMVSHFDTDHVEGLIYVMKEIKVKNVIISKQPENSENFEQFIQIAKNKKINVIVVNKGDILNVEKNLYFKILWPNSEKTTTENTLNNNSLVAKLEYKNFSVLFTGDIEEVAEKRILQEYENNLQILNSTVLKVAHHGSKTSSTQNFVDLVKPKVVLIGVGANNKFGHPNEGVLERLENIRSQNL